MPRKYVSRVVRVVHQTAAGCFGAGVITKATMRKFDATRFLKVNALKPSGILAFCERENVSQAVLARHLNVTTGRISRRERGERRPSGPVLTLLSLIKRKGLAVLAEQD